MALMIGRSLVAKINEKLILRNGNKKLPATLLGIKQDLNPCTTLDVSEQIILSATSGL